MFLFSILIAKNYYELHAYCNCVTVPLYTGSVNILSSIPACQSTSNVVKSLIGLSAIHTVCLVGVVIRLGIAFGPVDATLGCRSVRCSFIAEANDSCF